ncbi:MAG: hypothetical protein RJQ04_17600 [Longimicrobiales bacterium]
MASRMNVWSGLTAVGVALVTMNFVPPRPPASSEWSVALERSHEEARALALEMEIRGARMLLQRRSWADSLSALALAGEGPVVGGPGSLPAEWLERLQDRVGAELAESGPIAESVGVGVFVQPRDRGESHRSIEGDQRTTQEWYVGQRDGRTYCLSVLAVHPRRVGAELGPGNGPWTGAQSQILGPCRFVARFGTPGPDVLRWLEAGAADYARATGELPASLPAQEWRKTRTLFGLRLGWIGRASVAADQCRAGIPEGCQELFLDPGFASRQASAAYLVANSDLLAAAPTNYDSPFGPLDDYLLDDLLREFGADAFGRFWTSDRPVAEAFETAFGTSAGTWMAGWTGREIERHEPGPGIRKGSLFGTGVLLSLFAVVGGLWARRRTVA